MMHIHFYTSALIVMNIVTTCPERNRRICGELKRTLEPFNYEKNDEKNHQNRQKRQNHQKRRFPIIRH
jgi:hypothetical protein